MPSWSGAERSGLFVKMLHRTDEKGKWDAHRCVQAKGKCYSLFLDRTTKGFPRKPCNPHITVWRSPKTASQSTTGTGNSKSRTIPSFPLSRSEERRVGKKGR